ncbi:lysine 5,6-aminomutase subunit alpha [Desulfitibacter alkalitolerans]|uniref:lysine 5,6-aminomutase subunit alpha n=1 Tax=Desulfitibacter alkalitolerans TaxID=264641 RepID=UPI000487D82C|nr:lysine 5,6-aminomutase subunit alpha [Desulfitibacter alkalitolerans]
MNRLNLDQALIAKARNGAIKIANDIQSHIDQRTTTSVERAVLRLFGIDGITEDGIPLPNVIVDGILHSGRLGLGAGYWFANGILHYQISPQDLAQEIAAGKINLTSVPVKDEGAIREQMEELSQLGISRIVEKKLERDMLMARLGQGIEPLLYVIVATGNIYEDVKQAQAAARQGADIIAVIRTTGQSLLDYVPYGPTTEGFGGTYATQENFRIMRQALDEVGEEAGKYIRLTNYCSGLCMPEMAAMGAMERLDVMLNDSMYGIIFRDINMERTFVDQYFSRIINGFANIIINTGEDNYLTTADAYEAAHTVTASQFINEQLALKCGMVPEQIALGHAYEINPEMENSFVYELAQALLARELFPRSPLKYMPPTKYMTGNIFKGHIQDCMFNIASIMSGQSIHLLGMLTEAIHTPHISDRYLAVESARYVFTAMRDIAQEIYFKEDGIIQKRAQQVLTDAVSFLEKVAEVGLMESISMGMFADISRDPKGGKGLTGVVYKEPGYFNPFINAMLKGGN